MCFSDGENHHKSCVQLRSGVDGTSDRTCESRPEESRCLTKWFWRIKSSKEKLMAAIDPILEASEETF